LSDLAHERLQVLDFEQSIYKPERGFHEIGALEHGYVGIIVGCTVQRIRSFWRFEGRERAGLRFWEGQAISQQFQNSCFIIHHRSLSALECRRSCLESKI